MQSKQMSEQNEAPERHEFKGISARYCICGHVHKDFGHGLCEARNEVPCDCKKFDLRAEMAESTKQPEARVVCAHLLVKWNTKTIGGLTTGWWCCGSGCGAVFIPRPVTDSQNEAQTDFLQVTGPISCIRCDYKTDSSLPYRTQEMDFNLHLDGSHSGWRSETLDRNTLMKNEAQPPEPRYWLVVHHYAGDERPDLNIGDTLHVVQSEYREADDDETGAESTSYLLERVRSDLMSAEVPVTEEMKYG